VDAGNSIMRKICGVSEPQKEAYGCVETEDKEINKDKERKLRKGRMNEIKQKTLKKREKTEITKK
jgi:hypothetical protein